MICLRCRDLGIGSVLFVNGIHDILARKRDIYSFYLLFTNALDTVDIVAIVVLLQKKVIFARN